MDRIGSPPRTFQPGPSNAPQAHAPGASTTSSSPGSLTPRHRAASSAATHPRPRSASPTSLRLPELASRLNPFEGHPDFEKVNNGDPKNGAVAFLPQAHWVRGMSWETRPELCRQVLASQVETLKQLRKHSAEHVIDEGANAQNCADFNDLNAHLEHELFAGTSMRELAAGMSTIVGRIDAGDGVDELMAGVDPGWLLRFMQIGAAKANLMERKTANAPSAFTLHAAIPPHFEATLSDLMAKAEQDPTVLSDPEALKFIKTQREGAVAFMAPKIIQKNPGKPVFLAFGGGHDFKDAFAGNQAPALYRFKSPALQAALKNPA